MTDCFLSYTREAERMQFTIMTGNAIIVRAVISAIIFEASGMMVGT